MSRHGLSIVGRFRGRALYVRPDGVLYASRHYTIWRSGDGGKRWARVASIPRGPVRRLAELSRLACRLLRHEVRAMVALSDGALVAANREGVFRAAGGEVRMQPSRIDQGTVPAWPPMWICQGPDDRLVWGEYFGNPDRREVRLFASDDGGRSFDVAHVFPAGQVRHIHNIIHDPSLGKYWVLTGDFGDEVGFGLLSVDFSEFDWVVRGRQEVRAVGAFDFGDRLVFGTDSELARNAILRMDKSTGKVERLQELEGSCIYACRFGGVYCLSSTVEPSKVNKCTKAQLWVSRDGEQWDKVYQATRDFWYGKYFQYGSLILPRCPGSDEETILFSGQALQGIDGEVFVARLLSDAP